MYFAYENMEIKHKNDVDLHKAQKMHRQRKLSSKLPAFFLHLNICSGSNNFTLSEFLIVLDARLHFEKLRFVISPPAIF